MAEAAGPAARIFRSLHLPLGDPFAVTGLLIHALFILVAIFADRLATHDPTEILHTAA